MRQPTKPRRIRIVDRPDLERDPHSKALLSTDKEALMAAKKKIKESRLLQELLGRVEMLEARMGSMEKKLYNGVDDGK